MKQLKKSNEKGFTLIELMIVVAIIGILAAIAIPNFMNYQCKANEREGQAVLNSIRTAMEAYYAETNFYALNTAELGIEIQSSDLYNPIVFDVDNAATPRTYQVDVTATLRQGVSEWQLVDGEIELLESGCN